eukprot:7224369-Prymnesium_polylepis.1
MPYGEATQRASELLLVASGCMDRPKPLNGVCVPVPLRTGWQSAGDGAIAIVHAQLPFDGGLVKLVKSRASCQMLLVMVLRWWHGAARCVALVAWTVVPSAEAECPWSDWES